jgi:two-component system sensor histidine kinase KdpD
MPSIEDAPHRPSPDALLAQARAEGRGRLKIYLGAAPGVGKTYEMLTDARKKLADGLDIAAGVIETHGRAETLALCAGLEILPRRRLQWRGRDLEEMDLDGLLARRPQVALVDEFAHTNVEGSRHPKRWMDVEELLAAGIDVWTTLNVQHVESLNDVVARITRVRVHETVPDAILERADEIELIDLTPDELIDRLHEGKVYGPEQARRALRNWFAPGNLAALRELAMRRAADRIDEQVRGHRTARGETAPWAANARLLVCVDDRVQAAEIVRHAKRLADAARAPWVAVHVRTARAERMSEAEKGRVADTLRLAARLGADTATLPGDSVAESLLAYAREQNVTQIVVGKAKRPWGFELVMGSVVRSLIDRAESIAIHVVPEEAGEAAGRSLGRLVNPPRLSAAGFLEAVALTALAALIAWPIDRLIDVTNLAFVFLAAVLVSALTRGLWPALLTAFLSVLVYNYLFTDPRFTLEVDNPENVVTLGAFALAAGVVSALAARARNQTLAARAEARTTRELLNLARGLASVADEDDVARRLAADAARAFDAPCVVFARTGVDGLRVAAMAPQMSEPTDADLAAARWALDKGQAVGRGADTLPGAAWLFVPLRTVRLPAGVLGIERATVLDPAERRRLDAMADQAATALERAHIARALEEGRVEMEAERLRATMLASLSHDLKTPIAGILGAASSLRTYGDRHDAATRAELLASIEGEAERMRRHVTKLLDMTRLDAGAVTPQREPLEVGEVVQAVLARAAPLAAGQSLRADIAPGLPLVRADAALLQQALFNLVENALLHGRPDAGRQGEVTVRAALVGARVEVSVSDRGAGLPDGDPARLFERFQRGGAAPGSGLGLAIARGFATLMDAELLGANRADGPGAVFTLALDAVTTA